MTGLYYYHLSTPLKFQSGDVLGYYQPNSKLRILEENNGPRAQLDYKFSASTPPRCRFHQWTINLIGQLKYSLMQLQVLRNTTYTSFNILFGGCVFQSAKHTDIV